MMDFEEFKASVADQIKDYLPEKYADATVDLQNVTKNNDTVLTGLLIRNEDSNIAPNIYLELLRTVSGWRGSGGYSSAYR